MRSLPVILLLVMPACGPDRPPVAACIERHGAKADLDREPSYAVDYVYRWAMQDGCEVRRDHIMTSDGGECIPEPMIITGWPVGSRVTKSNHNAYVHDPDPEIRSASVVSGFDPDAELLDTAEDTGLRYYDDFELWVESSDEEAIYLVKGEETQRVPLDPIGYGCD